MDFDFHFFSEHINSMASVFSVEVFPDGSYGNIRLVTGNEIFSRNLTTTAIRSEKRPFTKLNSHRMNPMRIICRRIRISRNSATEALFLMKRSIPTFTPKECLCGCILRQYRLKRTSPISDTALLCRVFQKRLIILLCPIQTLLFQQMCCRYV